MPPSVLTLDTAQNACTELRGLSEACSQVDQGFAVQQNSFSSIAPYLEGTTQVGTRRLHLTPPDTQHKVAACLCDINLHCFDVRRVQPRSRQRLRPRALPPGRILHPPIAYACWRTRYASTPAAMRRPRASRRQPHTAAAQALCVTLVTLPSITAVLPSRKAMRERPSQFLNESTTSGCVGLNTICAISFDLSECGSSSFLPPVSLPTCTRGARRERSHGGRGGRSEHSVGDA